MTTRALRVITELILRCPHNGRSYFGAYRPGPHEKKLVKRVFTNVLGRSLAMTSVQP